MSEFTPYVVHTTAGPRQYGEWDAIIAVRGGTVTCVVPEDPDFDAPGLVGSWLVPNLDPESYSDVEAYVSGGILGARGYESPGKCLRDWRVEMAQERFDRQRPLAVSEIGESWGLVARHVPFPWDVKRWDAMEKEWRFERGECGWRTVGGPSDATILYYLAELTERPTLRDLCASVYFGSLLRANRFGDPFDEKLAFAKDVVASLQRLGAPAPPSWWPQIVADQRSHIAPTLSLDVIAAQLLRSPFVEDNRRMGGAFWVHVRDQAWGPPTGWTLGHHRTRGRYGWFTHLGNPPMELAQQAATELLRRYDPPSLLSAYLPARPDALA